MMRLLILMLCILPANLQAHYEATVLRVVDGDTIKVSIELLPNELIHTSLIRVSGVDTPELRGKCPEEKEAAREAKEFVIEWVGETVSLDGFERDKYGRWLADVTRDGKALTDALIASGHGRPYDGGKRRGWCE